MFSDAMFSGVKKRLSRFVALSMLTIIGLGVSQIAAAGYFDGKFLRTDDLQQEQNTVRTYNLLSAYPVKWTGPANSSSENTVAIEELTLNYEKIEYASSGDLWILPARTTDNAAEPVPTETLSLNYERVRPNYAKLDTRMTAMTTHLAPEPTSLMLLVTGLVGLVRRR